MAGVSRQVNDHLQEALDDSQLLLGQHDQVQMLITPDVCCHAPGFLKSFSLCLLSRLLQC